MTSDPVGYGFVIRGSRPVYVHTVDPSGPAAAAGLQVGGVKPKDASPLYRTTCMHMCVCVCVCVCVCDSLCVFVGMTTFSIHLCMMTLTS